MGDLNQAEVLSESDKVLRKYLKPDLLINDDMGSKKLPKNSGEYLFEIIMRRYELRSTIMTSNRPLEDWGKLIGGVPTAGAILDRFLSRSEIIQIVGKSYRLRNKTFEQKREDGKENNKRKWLGLNWPPWLLLFRGAQPLPACRQRVCDHAIGHLSAPSNDDPARHSGGYAEDAAAGMERLQSAFLGSGAIGH